MTSYLVTGGAGFIGSHIATALIKRGDRVRVLDNLSTGHRDNLAAVADDIEFVHADLLDIEAVERAVAGTEVVFHQAALASVPRSVAVPLDSHAACATGTLNLLEAARHAGVRRVVYAGSSSVYGDVDFSPKRETLSPEPLSPYAAAKLSGEYYCRVFTHTFGLETVTIRYFNVFGPRQDPTSEYAAVIPLFATAMIAGRRPTIFGDGTQSRDFTYVDNVVAGNLAAAAAPHAPGRCFNVACGDQTNLLELVDAINSVLGTEIRPVFAEPRAGDVHESLADITAAREILGYTPRVSFEEGLRRSIDYYQSLVGA